MKFKGSKLSKRTVALFAAAAILLGTGGTMGTRAALTVQSDPYDKPIVLAELDVSLTENGETVDDGGALYASVGDKIEPGRTYKDTIGVKNSGQADEYVRVIVRKYWTDTEGNEVTKNTDLKPEMIELDLADGWTEKDGGSDETKVYYYNTYLSKGEEVTLFNSLKISKDVMEVGKGKTVETDGTKTIYKYTYEYNGYSYNVEAEAQGVQTHSGDEAIKSIWGVDAGDTGITLKAND